MLDAALSNESGGLVPDGDFQAVLVVFNHSE